MRPLVAVQSVVSLYEPVGRHKNLKIESVAAPDLVIQADLDLLTTVLRNLLGNAIKFTPSGGTVREAAEALGTGNGGGVVFSVTDSGVGMSAAALAAVFGAARVTSQSGTAGESGTGLGLPLCRRFVALLGGELHAELLLKIENQIDQHERIDAEGIQRRRGSDRPVEES